MSVIQCQICQVDNEETAQFCRECGGRLAPPKPSMPAPAPAPQNNIANPASPPPAPARPKLRSPLFGGGGDNDDEVEDQPVLNKSKSKGLRSPLLRSDDDEDEPLVDPKINNTKSRGGGGLRSPIFGGGGDKNKDHKSTFPHRTHEFDQEDEPRPAAKLEQGRHQSKGLRSPLLGGDDFDPEAGISEDPGIQGKAAGQVKAHHRLRSPILGDVQDSYEDELFDEEAEDIDDPTVLRSPLLAVKARPKTNQPGQPTSPAPEQQKPPAPMQMQSPLSKIQQLQQAQPTQQGYGYSQPGQINQGGNPGISNPASFSATGTNPVMSAPVDSVTSASSAASPPHAPTSAPSYEPKPAPSPTNSQYSMAAQSAPTAPVGSQAISPSGTYDYGVQTPAPLPAPNLPSAPAAMPPNPGQSMASMSAMSAMSANSTPSSPISNPSARSADEGKRAIRGSKLLPGGDTNNDDDDEDLLNMGPKDRRGKSRERRAPRTDRRSSLDIDDDDDVLPMAGGRRMSSQSGAGGGNPMAPLLMASAALALICKLYVFLPLLGLPDLFTKYLPSTVDTISSMAVLVCLILFALKASQKG